MTKRFRLLIVAALVIIGGLLLWPTVNWYFVLDTKTRELASGSREQIAAYSKGEADKSVDAFLKLIDADPTTHAVKTEVADKDLPADFDVIIPAATGGLQERKIAIPTTWKVKDVLSAFEDLGSATDALHKAVETKTREKILSTKTQSGRIIQLGLDLKGGISAVIRVDSSRLEKLLGHSLSNTELSDAFDATIEALKKRIDKFSISEPSVRKDVRAGRIYVDIPGNDDPERVKALLMGGGALQLQLMDSDATDKLTSFLATYKQQNGKDWLPADGGLPADLVPQGESVKPFMEKDDYGIDQVATYLVINDAEESTIDGANITDATVTRDSQLGTPNVTFTLTKTNDQGKGALKFASLTKANIGKQLAIVLDGKVKAHARIQSEIPNGSVLLSGFSLEEGQNISKVLKSGSLVLDLSLESQGSVGASLGEDAIRSGLMSMIVGFGLVFLFMLVYYLGCGIIADIALILKLFLMFAILASLNLTLTLTSIAGLILTVGIAVDANVIIFERIKDELRLGKGRAAAVAGGYKKAFWTIIDSNSTNLIAAVLLAYLGTGPIQGFAVTLIAGIITSLFSSLFVSRLIQDFETEQMGHTKMSIAWRLK